MGDEEAADLGQDAPRMLCSMSLSPTPQRQPTSRRTSEGRAPAVIPCDTQLWRKEKLIIKLQNRHFLDEWGISENKFRACVNRWCPSTVNGEQNYIPTFEFDSECAKPDIIVNFNEEGQNESDVGARGDGQPTVVCLDLSNSDKNYREHLIVHEFGHALGLGHEHQRSDFWEDIKLFINKTYMKEDLGGRYVDWEKLIDTDTSKHTSYDPDSVMHYWFNTRWLMRGYSKRENIVRDENILAEGAKAALYGVHKRDRNCVTKPSFGDLKFLSDEYERIRGDQADPADNENSPKASSASTVSAGPPSSGTSGATGQPLWLSIFTNKYVILILLVSIVIGIGIAYLKPELKDHHKDESLPLEEPKEPREDVTYSPPKPTPVNTQRKSCQPMDSSDSAELAKIIQTHGSAKQWCSFLKLDESTCNLLDYSSQHPQNVILDVAKAYFDQKLNPCWEDIVGILCNKLNKQSAALKLSEKHGVHYSSQCS